MATSETPVSKGDFARICNVSPGRVTQWIQEGKISGPALVGEGRSARIVPSIARKQIKARTDSGQAFGNGLKTNLDQPARLPRAASKPERPAGVPGSDALDDPAASGLDKLDTRIKQERLEALERANRKAAEDEAAAQGRYTSTAATRRQLTMVAAQTMRIFEGALPEFASALAAIFKVQERDVLLILNEQFRKVRDQATQAHKRAAETLPSLMADDEASPEA